MSAFTSYYDKNVFINRSGMTDFHLSDVYDLAIAMDTFYLFKYCHSKLYMFIMK